MMDSLFTYGIIAKDPTYNTIRDGQEPYIVKVRWFIEDLWQIYKPYADSDFPQKIQEDFDVRFWEMYFTCSLLEASIPLSW